MAEAAPRPNLVHPLARKESRALALLRECWLPRRVVSATGNLSVRSRSRDPAGLSSKPYHRRFLRTHVPFSDRRTKHTRCCRFDRSKLLLCPQILSLFHVLG